MRNRAPPVLGILMIVVMLTLMIFNTPNMATADDIGSETVAAVFAGSAAPLEMLVITPASAYDAPPEDLDFTGGPEVLEAIEPRDAVRKYERLRVTYMSQPLAIFDSGYGAQYERLFNPSNTESAREEVSATQRSFKPPLA